MKRDYWNEIAAWFFIIIPTVFVILGWMFFKPPFSPEIKVMLLFPVFIGLIFIGLGAISEKKISEELKISGWIIFAFYWSTQINNFLEYQDLVNVFICIGGIYVLSYLAYHEWISIKTGEKISCLDWIAGAAAISGLIYFSMEQSPISSWLIESVATQSAALLNFFTGNIGVNGHTIYYNGEYAVTIIFACTAIQSIVLFVGMIFSLNNVSLKRKVYGLIVTVAPIYFLNLIRNASMAYLIGSDLTSFNIAHNWIGKGGSLVALVVLLFVVAKIVPEIFDEILCLIDLPKRKGPIERKIHNYFRRV